MHMYNSTYSFRQLICIMNIAIVSNVNFTTGHDIYIHYDVSIYPHATGEEYSSLYIDIESDRKQQLNEDFYEWEHT